MKRQLLHYTHVNTHQEQSPPINVLTRLLDGQKESISLNCSLNRISRDGMTLSCDRLTLDLLMPNRSGIAPKNPISMVTEFTLQSEIKANCRVIFIRRISKNEFVLELKFFEMAEKDMNLIDSFIENSLNGEKPLSKQATDAETLSKDNLQEKPSLHHINASSKAVFSKVA